MPVELVTSLHLLDADTSYSRFRERSGLWFIAEVVAPFTPGHRMVLNVILSLKDHRFKSGTMIDVHGELLHRTESGGRFDLEVYDEGVTFRRDSRFPLRPSLIVHGTVKERMNHEVYGRSILIDSMGTTDAPDTIVPLESMDIEEYTNICVGDPIHVSGLYGASIPTRINRSDGINIPTFAILLHAEFVSLPATNGIPHIPGRASSLFQDLEVDDDGSQESRGDELSDVAGEENDQNGVVDSEIEVEGENSSSENSDQPQQRAWSDGGEVEPRARLQGAVDGIAEDIDDILDRLGEPNLSYLEIGSYSSPVRGAVKRRRHEVSDGASSSTVRVTQKRR